MTDVQHAGTIDPIWEEHYASGHTQSYPWDNVVSFLFRYAPKDRPRSEVRIVELGFGTGSNLWFAAREGFSVAGIDGSPSAVDAARRRLDVDGLHGDLRLGLFPEVPFEDGSADLVIDRAAITCVGKGVATATVRAVNRILRPGGFFLLNVYSSEHASAAAGRRDDEGLVHDIEAGTIRGFGSICFYDEPLLREVLGDGWTVRQWSHVVENDNARPDGCHAEWRVVIEKLA